LPFDAPLAEPARTRRSSRPSAAPVQAPSESLEASLSRRDARAQRSASTGAQTVWSAPVESPAPVEAPVETISAAAPVIAETPVETISAAATSAPTQPATRASRRVRTAPVMIADDAPVIEAARAADDPSEPIVPAAAIAWAAAAAAAAASIDPHPIVPVEPVLAPAEPFELLEPATVEEQPEADEPEPADEPQTAASDLDEFELAARLFSFTGETAVIDDAHSAGEAADADEAPTPEPVAASHVASPRRRTRHVSRQVATASFSVGVMGIVGLLTVGMTTPAVAVAAVSGTDSTSLIAEGTDAEAGAEDIQAYVAPASIENASLDRSENYTSVSMGEIAAQDGITNYSNFFVNDANAAIQWPFAVGVPITFGFGMRSGRMHEGADFVPGQGADVQAIADGTVRIATNSGGAYGVTVVIDHIIDGQLVSSRYAHMLVGSLKVSVGQHVTVGTILGNTGNTGRSYGAHTHFEILQGGTTAIDPIVWLRSYAGRYSLDHW
jgi:murein DD-endopeptidase MepM/ murein hydrolase activator NlpD